MKKQKFLIVSALCLAVMVAAGCTNPFARKQKPEQNPDNGQSINSILEKQGEMKKFANEQEMKTFFEKRPQNAGQAVSLNAAAPMGLGAKDSVSSEAVGRGGGGGGYSATNIQVQGVDEADVTKTDGKFIYTIVDKKIIIASALPAEDAAIVGTISFEGRPQEFYINGDKLVAFGYDEVVYNPSQPVFRPMTPSVFAAVYNISDRTKPSAIKMLKFDGGYSSSRMIDNRVYLVTSNYNYYPADSVSLPKISENGKELSVNPDVYYIDTPANFDATSVSVLDLDALEAPLRSNVYFMPSGQTIYASRGTLYLSYTKYISEYEIRMAVIRDIMLNRLPEKERGQINAISALDSFILNNDEKSYKINQIIENYIMRLPAPEQENVAKQINEEFNARFQNLYKQLETTVVHKISLNNGDLSYEGSGEVSGRILNQFSMDENNGTFRIATTRGQSWFIPFPIIAQKMIAPQAPAQESYNNIFVLDEKMNTVGTLENLAKGERIYSVRFMNERAYVVTFKQTDPLFVIDLANASEPKVIGEVKLPGFSNYLHPYSETVLIGVGKEATDNGDRGVETGGIKVSLFDVADPAAPKEITNVVLGGKGSDSAVLYDHKAFLFSADKQLLVLPLALTKAGSQNYSVEFQGAAVFRITPTSIAERGRIYHASSAERRAAGFTPTEPIQRSIYIGDNLYTVSQALIQINNLESLAMVKTIALPMPQIQQDKPMPLAEPATTR